MSSEVSVYVCTALAAVVVALTRLRLAGPAGGRVTVSSTLANAHTIVGSAALVTWVTFLITSARASEGIAGVVGIVALACWWTLGVLGVLILVRWLPSRGRHASAGQADRWRVGPWLSVLAHLGMLYGVAVFTYAYLINSV